MLTPRPSPSLPQVPDPDDPDLFFAPPWNPREWGVAFFFVSYVVFVAIVLMNVVIAVLLQVSNTHTPHTHCVVFRG